MRTLLAAATMLFTAHMSIAAQMSIAHAAVSCDRYHAATHRHTKTQKAWFALAIADILTGKPLSSDEVPTLHSSVKDGQAPRIQDAPVCLHASQ